MFPQKAGVGNMIAPNQKARCCLALHLLCSCPSAPPARIVQAPVVLCCFSCHTFPAVRTMRRGGGIVDAEHCLPCSPLSRGWVFNWFGIMTPRPSCAAYSHSRTGLFYSVCVCDFSFTKCGGVYGRS